MFLWELNVCVLLFCICSHLMVRNGDFFSALSSMGEIQQQRKQSKKNGKNNSNSNKEDTLKVRSHKIKDTKTEMAFPTRKCREKIFRYCEKKMRNKLSSAIFSSHHHTSSHIEFCLLFFSLSSPKKYCCNCLSSF